MKCYSLAAALWLTVLAANAQRTTKDYKDYVVTAKGDTLRGQIQLTGKHNQTVVLYRYDQEPSRFTATEASSYGDASGPVGVSKQVGAAGSPMFVTSLVRGYVSLYSGSNADGARRFYLQPADSTHIVEIPPVFTPLVLLPLLPNCPALRLEYAETSHMYSYTPSGMSKMVIDYNTCQRPQQPSIANYHPYGLHTAFGIKAGINASSFTTDIEPFSGKHQDFVGYQAGVFLRFYSQSKFSVLIEPTYLALRSVYGPTPIPNGYAYYTTNQRISIQYSQVQVPLLFRYTAGHGSMRPYLNAGISYGLNFGNRSVRDFHYTMDSNQAAGPVDNSRTIVTPDSRSVGLATGAGMLLYQPSLPVLSVELRFDRMLDSFGSLSTTYHNSLRFDLGIMF
ncbi:porin family protein [Hymenobacter sp. GOD-10R]|uniref:porin family protein n=1 Tax=Hymenobacter sp. GOD-10R TaxID=3093922 RepID=UPI002D78951E|nr:porin family protein [Hymenobacter sp. GOD-10R]WRQ30219.1 porin family protein [Hymenobacter sp. GOD-10R]